MRNYLLSFLFISSSVLAIDPFFGEQSHIKMNPIQLTRRWKLQKIWKN